MIASFSVLLYFGGQIYHKAPPIPESFKTSTRDIVYTRADIQSGQNIWQSLGGMQQGSIWGHGSYLAPDWSADWLHREALALLALIENDELLDSSISPEHQFEMHKVSLRKEIRENTYNPNTGVVTISPNRAQAIATVAKHYINLFTAKNKSYLELRKDYAFPLNSVLDKQNAQKLSAFFFWSAWSAVTNRPNDDVSYTSNWPHDPLVGNTPTASVFMWSIISILLLLAGIGAIVWYYARQFDIWRSDLEPEKGYAKDDAMDTAKITPSMRATAKYFWVVTALFIVQI